MNGLIIFSYTLLFCIIGYLLGSLIFAQLIAWILKDDITKSGSTNPGATNIRRKYGFKLGLLVAFLDAIKGMIAIVINWSIYYCTIYKINPDPNLFSLVYLSGTFVVIGHCFPLMFVLACIFFPKQKEKRIKYKGGKGVSTSGGVLFMISPYLGLISFCIWLFITFSSKYVSLGSIFCMTIAPLFIFIPQIAYFYLFNNSVLFNEPLNYDLMYSICPWLIYGTFISLFFNGLIIVYRHKSNIRNLINHNEKRI